MNVSHRKDNAGVSQVEGAAVPAVEHPAVVAAVAALGLAGDGGPVDDHFVRMWCGWKLSVSGGCDEDDELARYCADVELACLLASALLPQYQSAEVLERLMRRSLAARPLWDEAPEYLRATCEEALRSDAVTLANIANAGQVEAWRDLRALIDLLSQGMPPERQTPEYLEQLALRFLAAGEQDAKRLNDPQLDRQQRARLLDQVRDQHAVLLTEQLLPEFQGPTALEKIRPCLENLNLPCGLHEVRAGVARYTPDELLEQLRPAEVLHVADCDHIRQKDAVSLCPFTRPYYLKKKCERTGRSIIIAPERRCGRLDCPVCGDVIRRRWKENIDLRLRHAADRGRQLWVGVVARDPTTRNGKGRRVDRAWETASTAISSRRGGNYFRAISAEDEYTAVTDVNPGRRYAFRPITAAEARTILLRLLEAADGGKPIVATRNWTPPGGEPKTKDEDASFEFLGSGTCKLPAAEALVEICDRYRVAQKRLEVPVGERGTMGRKMLFVCPAVWSDDKEDDFLFELNGFDYPVGRRQKAEQQPVTVRQPACVEPDSPVPFDDTN